MSTQQRPTQAQKQVAIYGVNARIETMQTAAKDKESTALYVVNRSNPRGNIFLTVKDGSGNAIPVTIPVTPMPVDMTTQVPRRVLLENPVFRRLILGNHALLINEEDAEEIISTPEGQLEMARVFNLLAQGVGLSQEEFASSQIDKATNPMIDDTDGVSGFAMQTAMQGQNEGDLNEDAVVHNIAAHDGELTKKDYEYISRTSVYSRVKAVCADKAHGM